MGLARKFVAYFAYGAQDVKLGVVWAENRTDARDLAIERYGSEYDPDDIFIIDPKRDDF